MHTSGFHLRLNFRYAYPRLFYKSDIGVESRKKNQQSRLMRGVNVCACELDDEERGERRGRGGRTVTVVGLKRWSKAAGDDGRENAGGWDRGGWHASKASFLCRQPAEFLRGA